MSFLYPAVLWFLGLLLIPIFIHLFNLRRYEKIFFSNVNFLDSVKSSSRSKLTIKQWLALISRLLALGFLVVTFAVPFIPGDFTEKPGNRNVIFLDNSYSNSNIARDGLTAFDNSSELVISYLDQHNLEDKFYFATNDSYSRTDRTIDQIKDEISELGYVSDSRGLDRLTNAIGNSNASSFYLFSDFQSNQFDFELAKRDTVNDYYLFPSTYEVERNVYVDSIYLDNPVLNGAIENQLNIRLRNAGRESVNGLPVFFTVNDVQISANSVDIEPYGFKDLTIDVSGLNDSISNCVVSMEDFPVTFDNRFYFTLQRTKKIKVLEVYGKPDLKYVKRVFDSELFAFSSQSISNFNYSLVNEIDFLVLNQVEGSDAGLITVVQDFVNQGGSVLYIPPATINDPGLLQRLTNGIVTVAGADSQEGTLSKPASSNPFFSGVFDGKSAQIDEVEANAIISWQHGEDILSFKNGLSFLSQFAVGDGRVYGMSSSLEKSQSGFAESSLFLPVMYKMVFASLTSQSLNLYHRKDAALIAYEGPELSQDKVFRLRKDGAEIIPPQRKVNGQVVFDVSEVPLEPGFWEVCDEQSNCSGILPINESKNESVVVQTALDALEEIALDQENITVLNTASLEASVGKGVEALGNKYFWKYALLLALVFFFVEVLILRFL